MPNLRCLLWVLFPNDSCFDHLFFGGEGDGRGGSTIAGWFRIQIARGFNSFYLEIMNWVFVAHFLADYPPKHDVKSNMTCSSAWFGFTIHTRFLWNDESSANHACRGWVLFLSFLAKVGKGCDGFAFCQMRLPQSFRKSCQGRCFFPIGLPLSAGSP